MFFMGPLIAFRAAEVDLQPVVAEGVERRADVQKDGVLRRAHDFQVKLLVQLIQSFACLQPLFRPGKHIAQPGKVFVRRSRSGQFRRLDLVDFPHLDRLEDLAVLQGQTEAGEEGHRLDPATAAVDVYARFGAALYDLHRFQNGQRLAHLSPADGEVFGKIAFRRGLAVVLPGRFHQIGGEGRKELFLLHAWLRLHQLLAYRAIISVSMSSPRPGPSGTAMVPSCTTTGARDRVWIIGFAPSENSTM